MKHSSVLLRVVPGVARVASLALLLASAPVAAAQTPPVTPPAQKPDSAKNLVINRVLAVVNNEPILLSEVMDRAIRMRPPDARPDSAGIAALQQAALEALIDDQLLMQKAKAEKVEAQESDVQTAANDYVKETRARFQTDAEFNRALRESGFGTMEEFKKSREDEMRGEMVRRDLIGKLKDQGRIPAVGISEAEITEEFERSKASLPKREASVSFRQIIFPIEPSAASKRRARAKIDSLAKELEGRPEDFENVAKRESMDGSRELGGDLGWNRRGATVPEFERVIFSMNPGIISPVVETVFGYHLIRVDRIKAGEVKARHILIKFSVDSTDQERALKLADSVATAWRAGANYDTLTSQFHDDDHQEDRSVPDFRIDSLPLSYQGAVRGHKVGDIVGPFTIHDATINLNKPVVIQITEMKAAGDFTIAELRQRIRSNLTEYRSMRRFLDSLKNEAYVWVLDPAKPRAADAKP